MEILSERREEVAKTSWTLMKKYDEKMKEFKSSSFHNVTKGTKYCLTGQKLAPVKVHLTV